MHGHYASVLPCLAFSAGNALKPDYNARLLTYGFSS